VVITTLIAMMALLVFLAMRSRRNPLFLAGAAAYLALGRSIFIDIWPNQPVLGLALTRFTAGDLLAAALGLGWLYARTRRPVPCVRLAPVWARLGILIAAFFAVEFVLACVGFTELHPALMLTTRDWFYIPLGYFITLDVLRRFTTDETAQYIGVLSLFTVFASVLYVASSLGLPIYSYRKNLVTVFAGTTIIRDFSPVSFWAGLAWCYYLSRPRKGVWTYVALAAVASGVLISYSRQFIALLVATAVLATALMLVRHGQRVRVIIIVGVACAALVAVVLTLGPVVAPAQIGYLQERLGLLVQSGSIRDDLTTQLRLRAFDQARAAGARVDPFVGAGLFDSSGGMYGRYWSSDSDWIGIVYSTGWTGVIVLAMPFGVGLWRAIRGFTKRQPSSVATTLLLTGCLSTAWYLGYKFGSDAYVWWPAVSLLPVALIARAEAVPAAAAAARVPVSYRAQPFEEPAGLLNEVSRS